MLEAEAACRQLRSSGLRLTPQRRAVIEAMAGNRSHPTADEVARDVARTMPGVSLSTVYKVLHELTDLGLVREIDVRGAVMRFDPNPEDHVHVVCVDCGSVLDSPLPADTLHALTAALQPSVRTVDRVDVVVRGTCRACE